MSNFTITLFLSEKDISREQTAAYATGIEWKHGGISLFAKIYGKTSALVAENGAWQICNQQVKPLIDVRPDFSETTSRVKKTAYTAAYTPRNKVINFLIRLPSTSVTRALSQFNQGKSRSRWCEVPLSD